MHASWGLAKWLFANQFTLSVQSYVGYWILAWTNGMAAAGVYTACMSIALFSNPFILGSSNVLAPRAALAWAEGGCERLRRDSVRAVLPLAAGMTVFCAVVLSAGNVLMHMLFPGEEYGGQGGTISVLAVAMLAVALSLPATSALISMERPHVVFWAGLGAACLNGVLVWRLGAEWGLIGAACGLLAGNVTRSAACWGVFLTVTSRTGSKPHPAVGMGPGADFDAVASVLREFSQVDESDDWVLEKLGKGWQADVYRVWHSDRRQPVWLNHRSLAVKLYKREAAREVEEVRREFESLCRLYQAVNGRAISGWKICSPHPLYMCESPLAIVMSVVPGKRLNDVLDADECALDVMKSLPRTVTAAIAQFWLDGKSFGDLNLDNILCSAATRALAFVDPILPPDEILADAVPRSWYPGSHDLARLLYETAVTARAHPGGRRERQRKATFVANVLQACVGIIAAPGEEKSVLDEIEACAQEYLKALKISLSLRGAWRTVLRPIAAGRIEEIVNAARHDAVYSQWPRLTSAGLGDYGRAKRGMDQQCHNRRKA
jgi:hypothetical protein